MKLKVTLLAIILVFVLFISYGLVASGAVKTSILEQKFSKLPGYMPADQAKDFNKEVEGEFGALVRETGKSTVTGLVGKAILPTGNSDVVITDAALNDLINNKLLKSQELVGSTQGLSEEEAAFLGKLFGDLKVYNVNVKFIPGEFVVSGHLRDNGSLPFYLKGTASPKGTDDIDVSLNTAYIGVFSLSGSNLSTLNETLNQMIDEKIAGFTDFEISKLEIGEGELIYNGSVRLFDLPNSSFKFN